MFESSVRAALGELRFSEPRRGGVPVTARLQLTFDYTISREDFGPEARWTVASKTEQGYDFAVGRNIITKETPTPQLSGDDSATISRLVMEAPIPENLPQRALAACRMPSLPPRGASHVES